MSELSDEARALLAREAPLDEPTAVELERGRARIFASLGLPLPDATVVTLPETATPDAPTVARNGVGGSGLGMKLAAVTLAAGLAVVGVVTMRGPQTSTPARPPAQPETNTPSAPRVARATPEPDVLPEAPREAETTMPADTTASRPATSSRETERDALATESMLVAAAEAQLRAGHASEALSLFDRYLSEHPRGALRHESLAGRIASLCRLGRLDAGRAELARFAERFPRSPSLPRLESACGVEP